MIKTAITGPWRFAVYLVFAYLVYYLGYHVERENYYLLISVYGALFVLYLLILRYFDSEKLAREGKYVGIIIRLILLFSLPHLSDDFYRYIWDGRIIEAGHNPFLYTPHQIADLKFNLAPHDHLTKNLYAQLNSKEYYSVYPPVSQFIFYLSNLFSGPGFYNDIWMMRFFIILFEAGTIFFLSGVIKSLNLNPANVFIYAFNPLIIIELTGNIHFEAIMIFYLAAAFYFLLRRRIVLSAILFGLAVSTKLLPLIFLPLLFRYIGTKKTILYSAIVVATAFLCFLPFLSSELIRHFASGIQLYFNEFEYNASFYYLGKWIGGWNSEEVKLFLQKLFPVITFLGIVFFSYRYSGKNFIAACTAALFLYFILATTVHPWYITSLLLFASILNYRFIIWWSGIIILTYITYVAQPYAENFWLIAIEYLIVFFLMTRELSKRREDIKGLFQ